MHAANTSVRKLIEHSQGKIRHCSHLGDTDDQVLDVRDDGADGSSVARSAPPDLDEDLVADLLDVDLEVLEAALQGTTRTSDGNLTALDGHGDCTQKVKRERSQL